MKIKTIISLFLASLMAASSCKPQNDWLDVKRNLSDVAPTTIVDMQAIMDNSNSFNSNYPMLGLLATDNLYLLDKNISGAGQIERNAYLWAKDIFQTSTAVEFSSPYNKISAVNLVLEGLDKLPATTSDQSTRNDVQGQALFHRAFAYYSLSQLFCKSFQPETASTDPGLQLRRSSDPNIIVKRSTVAETYHFILEDLRQALTLLPEKPLQVARPGKAACRGLLAKVYLAMKDYSNAATYAHQAIGDSAQILDFNSSIIKPETSYAFPAYSNPHRNPEIIFFANAQSWASIWPASGVAYVDSTLFNSYSGDDLRKTLFFRKDSQGLPRFRGTYSGNSYNFGGIATNELLLIEAESLARTGRAQKGLQLLNQLLFGRYKSGRFTAYPYKSELITLALILDERRKELAFTAQLRWEDLRRMPPSRPIVHYYQGARFELAAKDLRWVFPFPAQEIAMSNVEQNPR